MRLTSSILIPALCWTARLAAAAQVYTFDPESLPGELERSRTLSPIEARLVLAQRTGVEDYHIGDLLSPGGIEAINRFGAKQQLFTGDLHVKRRIQILVEVEEDVPSSIDAKDTSLFTISPSPSADSTRSLFLDLARQRWPSIYSHLSDSDALDSLEKATISHDAAGNEAEDAFHVVRKSSMQDFERFWQDLITLAHEREANNDYTFAYSLTAIVVPSTTTTSKAAGEKKSTKAIWGSYSMPDFYESTTSSSPPPHHHQKRQQEAPLEEDTTTTTPPNPPTLLQQNENSTTPLPGILPACFSTHRACLDRTHNCTGHGTCRLAFTDTSHEEADAEPCYACLCVPTIVNSTDAEGITRSKTIVWGGPACQKRDVSTSFWLLAGITVGMVGLVGFAVGSLMACGEEDLPSVIGAGVSGVGGGRR